MRKRVVTECLAIASIMIANLALAELPYRTPVQTLTPEIEEITTEGSGGPGLGAIVSIREGVALISMTAVVPNEVAVFRFINGAWQRNGELPCPESLCSQVTRFLYRDSTAVVSTVDSSNRGQVLIFKQTQGQWHLANTIASPDPSGSFGVSLAFQDGTLAVGGHEYAGIGSLHVYQLSSSGRVRSHVTLRPEGIGDGAYFGGSVAMARDTIVAGTAGRNIVFVFRRVGGQWMQVQELHGTGGWEMFGSAIALNKGVLVVGAPASDRVGNAEIGGYQAGGMAYVYRERNGEFVFQQRFRPLYDVESNSYTDFGRHIAMFGNRVIIGAIDAPVIGAGEGLAIEYRITANGLQPVSQMRTPGAGGFALYHNTLIMGSPYDEALMTVGSASVFNIYLPLRTQ